MIVVVLSTVQFSLILGFGRSCKSLKCLKINGVRKRASQPFSSMVLPWYLTTPKG